MAAKPRRPAPRPTGAKGKTPNLANARTGRRQERTLENAVRYHQAGEFAAAARLYRQAQRRDPRNADILHLLAVATFQAGSGEDAIRYLEKAVTLRPQAPAFRSNLGNILRASGRLDEAIAQYREALKLQPEFADAHHNLATALHDQHRLEEAITHYTAAIRLNPNLARSHSSLGQAYRDKGDIEKARKHFERTLVLDPALPDGHVNLAGLLREQGRLDAAIQHYQRAITLRPERAETHVDLGRTLRAQGKTAEAADHLAKAIALKPDFAAAHADVAGALAELGRPDEAFVHVERALALKPDLVSARAIFAALVKYAGVTAYQPQLEARLIESFDSPFADPVDLARAAAGQVRLKYGIRHADDGRLLPDIDAKLVVSLGNDALLQRLLTQTVNPDAELERFLTALRRSLLLEYADAADIPTAVRVLISSLGHQCFNNEYIFAADEAETRIVEGLKTALDGTSAKTVEPNKDIGLLLIAMYEPLSALSQASALAQRPEGNWPQELHTLARRSLFEPMKEAELAPSIPSVAGRENTVSRAVRAQYEENPYPRWLSVARRPEQKYAAILRSAFPHFSPPSILQGPIRVLVAGCGTGKHPINVALDYADSEVVAVDLSRRSLAYGMRMAKELGLDNIRFIQADILDLAELNETFPVIECIGVLHHMRDPAEGWRILTDLLEPGGVMEIGLYSAKARENVVRARRHIENSGLKPTSTDIRRFRTRVLNGEAGADLVRLVDSEDFFSMSGCRDLLFNVQEHRFTLSQIRRMLDQQRLRFVGFNIPSPLITEHYRRSFPHDKDMTDLVSWDKFEDSLPNAFCEMYQFLCQKPVQ